jgi:Holliday junction resolvase RusA-like endonuclease
MRIVIEGKPIPKQRPRFAMKTGRAYSPQKHLMFAVMMNIKKQVGNMKPITCAVKVETIYYMPIPKNTRKSNLFDMTSGATYHTKTPDLDNLDKFIWDCMNGVVWVDDRQVAENHTKKKYSMKPRTEITITKIKGS